MRTSSNAVVRLTALQHHIKAICFCCYPRVFGVYLTVTGSVWDLENKLVEDQTPSCVSTPLVITPL